MKTIPSAVSHHFSSRAIFFAFLSLFVSLSLSAQNFKEQQTSQVIAGMKFRDLQTFVLENGNILVVGVDEKQAKAMAVLCNGASLTEINKTEAPIKAKGMTLVSIQLLGNEAYIFLGDGKKALWQIKLTVPSFVFSVWEQAFLPDHRIMQVQIDDERYANAFHTCFSADSSAFMIYCRYADGLHGDEKRWQYGAVVHSRSGAWQTWKMFEVPYTLRSTRILMISVTNAGNPMVAIAKAVAADNKTEDSAPQHRPPGPPRPQDPNRVEIIDDPEHTSYELITVTEQGIKSASLGKSPQHIVRMQSLAQNGDNFELVGLTSSQNNKKVDGVCYIDQQKGEASWKIASLFEAEKDTIDAENTKEKTDFRRKRFSDLFFLTSKRVFGNGIVIAFVLPAVVNSAASDNTFPVYGNLIVLKLSDSFNPEWQEKIENRRSVRPVVVIDANNLYVETSKAESFQKYGKLVRMPLQTGVAEEFDLKAMGFGAASVQTRDRGMVSAGNSSLKGSPDGLVVIKTSLK